jgi:hypothetical protein
MIIKKINIKILKLSYFLIFLLVLTGCTQNKVYINSYLPKYEYEQVSEINYTIFPKIFEHKGITITYPQFLIQDKLKQNIINDIIYEEMKLILNYFPGHSELTLIINYDIKLMSNRLLSVVYTGVGFVQDSAGPLRVFFTTNIDIENGEKVILSDILDSYYRLIYILKSEYAKYSIPEAREYIEEIISRDNFINRLKNADNSEFIGTVNKSEIFTYFNDSSLGISIGGLGRGVGNHVEIEFDYNLLFLDLTFKNTPKDE